MKYIALILINTCLFISTKVKSQVPDSLIHEFNSYKWIDLPVTDMHYEQANSYLNRKMKIEGKNFILFSDTFKNVKYSIFKKRKLDFLEFTGFDYRRMEITADSLLVLRVNSPINDFNPPHDIIILQNSLITEYGGFFYFFKKYYLQSKTTIPNDTVRCLYHEGNYCTGFVIQGTRKTGTVIHVKPFNKNVPMEIEERDSVPDLPKKKKQ